MKHLAIWSPRPDAPTSQSLSPNITVYGFPVIAINPIPFAHTALASADAVIFVSYHAVAQALSRLRIEDFLHKQIIAIGLRTQAALQQAGLAVNVTAPAPFSSEALLNDQAFQQLTCRRWVIISGVGGRQLLSDALKKNGRAVITLACYQRDKINVTAQDMVNFLQLRSVGAIILSSCEITEIVAHQIARINRKQLLTLPVFVLSDRIAQCAQRLGFTQVIVAPTANQHELNQCITNWWGGNQQ